MNKLPYKTLLFLYIRLGQLKSMYNYFSKKEAVTEDEKLMHKLYAS